jgi:hypothetical protein
MDLVLGGECEVKSWMDETKEGSFMFHQIFKTLCRIWGLHSGGYKEYHLLGYDAV